MRHDQVSEVEELGQAIQEEPFTSRCFFLDCAALQALALQATTLQVEALQALKSKTVRDDLSICIRKP